jgi:hypothetical protein
MRTSEVFAPRLFATPGTVLYVDQTSGELRHGRSDIIPSNARMLLEGSNPVQEFT